MAYRELFVVEIREVLRLWQKGFGFRRVARFAGVDRKTARRYVETAQALGLERDEDAGVSDELLASVVASIKPGPGSSVGSMRALCREHEELLARWVSEGCRSPKLARLLARHTGVVVPQRTLQRFVSEELGASSRRPTVRVADPAPGQVLEVDFALLGTFSDRESGRPRKLHALVCTATVSRHTFVWPCLSQTQEDVIAGLEAAWAFFGGVFAVVLPDNCKAVVERADPTSPRLNPSFLEYAQARGFVVDPARARRPRDKARVERSVRYARDDFFRGEDFASLGEWRREAARWCREVAGERVHGTTRRRPREHFEEDEQGLLRPAPSEPYDVPTWMDVTVGPDHVVFVDHALYSVPQGYDRRALRVRVDRATVKLYEGAAFVKAHPRVEAGQSSIDREDLPPGTVELAKRDGATLQARAARLGPSVGTYAERLLDDPRPWTRMRLVYRLLGLGKRYGGDLLEEACAQALALDVVDVTRIDRMLQRGLPARRQLVPPAPAPSGPPEPPSNVIPLRFLRDPSTYRTPRPGHTQETDAPA